MFIEHKEILSKTKIDQDLVIMHQKQNIELNNIRHNIDSTIWEEPKEVNILGEIEILKESEFKG